MRCTFDGEVYRYSNLLIVLSVLCAALVRAFGAVAEVPVLAVRPDLQGNRLGELLLAQLESALLEAGVKLLAVPAVPQALMDPEAAAKKGAAANSATEAPLQASHSVA